MRTSEIFILGTITGAVAVWLWGREIEHYVREKTRSVRAQAAAGIQAVDEKTGRVLDRSGNSLRRAEDFLQETKEHVSDALRAGQHDSPSTNKRKNITRGLSHRAAERAAQTTRAPSTAKR